MESVLSYNAWLLLYSYVQAIWETRFLGMLDVIVIWGFWNEAIFGLFCCRIYLGILGIVISFELIRPEDTL